MSSLDSHFCSLLAFPSPGLHLENSPEQQGFIKVLLWRKETELGLTGDCKECFFLLLLLFLFTPVTSARYAFEYFLFQMSGIRKKSLESQRCIASGG